MLVTRLPRIHYAGAVYHVTARGNNREVIFRDENDKNYYLSLVKKYKEKFSFSLYAYVLMDNHLHLLIEVANHTLAQIMQGIQQSYSKSFNLRYDRVGHVFQQRYDARLCTVDSYLRTVLKYIHANPVKAGIADTLNYRWSSHNSYIRGDFSFIDADKMLGLFANNLDAAILQYNEFMNVLEDIDLEEQVENTSLNKTLGDNVFFEPLLSKEGLLDFIYRETTTTAEKLLSGSRVRNVVAARKMMIYLAMKGNIATGSELANLLKVSPSRISRGYYEVAQNKTSLQTAEQLIQKMMITQQCNKAMPGTNKITQ